MSKRLMILAGVALVVVLLGAAVVVPALAQEPTPEPEAPSEAPCAPHGRGFGFWGGSWDTFDAAAEALGLTPEQLFAELRTGKSLADIAEAQGVDLETVQEAMNAARAEAMKEAIEQAVEDGRLTQAQADWLLKGLELGFLPGGRGFGFGHGMGGGFGHGMRGGFGSSSPRSAPSTAPSSSSL
jgi:hypothetical protein